MSVKARVIVWHVDAHPTYRNVTLSPVYSSDKSDPNYSYSQATPSGEIKLTITNPAAWPLFEPGASLDVTFEPTPVVVAETPAAIAD